MFCKRLLLTLLMMYLANSYGQKYPYKQFTTNNGLINNRCGNVSQDSAGYIWITSDNGICNYDGRKFTFFPGKNSTYYFAHTNTINMYKGQCVFATGGEGFALGLGNKLSFSSSTATLYASNSDIMKSNLSSSPPFSVGTGAGVSVVLSGAF